jgi:hypothetical protein
VLRGSVVLYSLWVRSIDINNCLGTVRDTQFCAGRSDISSCLKTAQLTEVSGQKIVVLVQVHCKCSVGLNFQTEIQRGKVKERPYSEEYSTVIIGE